MATLYDEWASEKGIAIPKQTRATAQPAPKPKGRGGFITSLISEGGALGGGLKGAALGSFAGPLGTVVGGGLGAFLGGTVGRLAENKIRDDEFRPTEALKEGAISGVLGAGPIKLAKAGAGAVRGGKEGAEQALNKSIFSKVTKGKMGGIEQGLKDRATTNILKLTPSQTKKMLDSGIDPNKIATIANRYGKNAEEIIGRTGNKGPLQATIKSLEAGIESEARKAGKNILIPGDDIIKGLKTQRKALASKLGSDEKVKALDQLIADAQKRYGKGVTVIKARQILKEANEKFGASIIDDAKGAVATDAQKLVGNVMRDSLKTRFPAIKQALDDEAELILLREILKGTRAKDITGGYKTGKLDLTRPGSFLDPLLNSRAVSRKVLGEGTEKIPGQPNKLGFASRILAGNALDQSKPELTPEEDFAQAPALEPPQQMQNVEMPPEDNNPYSPANVQANVEQILAQGGTQKDVSEYLSNVQTIQELTKTSMDAEKPLSSIAAKQQATANSGLDSLNTLEQIINTGGVPKGTVVPGRGFAGNLGANVLGTASFDAAADNIADVIIRMRTGAAATKDEMKTFRNQLPLASDSPEVARQKLDTVRNYLLSISNGTGEVGSNAEDLLSQIEL